MKSLLFILILLSTCRLSAQSQLPTDTINLIDNHSTTWRTYFENDQIRIEFISSNCEPSMGYDFEQVNFKFINKTSTKLDLNWHIHLYYDKKCLTCNYPDEYARTIQLLPNETLEGNCDRETINELKLFSKFIDVNYSKGAILTSFQLASLNIAFPQ
jgi:hypothetical protein